MKILHGCKLTYFNLPGRGEATRLALSIGNVKFTDERIQFPSWKELKPNTPWGSLPILTLTDGTVIAQQRAILRFVGREVGLYPSDPVAAARVDELIDATEDLLPTTNKVGEGLNKEEKEAARKAACEEGGVVYQLLTKIDRAISENDTSVFAVGDSLTIADVFIYCNSTFIVSGLYDGIPSDALDSFVNLNNLRKEVRSNPSVCTWYDNLDSTVNVPTVFAVL